MSVLRASRNRALGEVSTAERGFPVVRSQDGPVAQGHCWCCQEQGQAQAMGSHEENVAWVRCPNLLCHPFPLPAWQGGAELGIGWVLGLLGDSLSLILTRDAHGLHVCREPICDAPSELQIQPVALAGLKHLPLA